MSDQEQKDRQVDARVISLYSKGTQDSRFLPKTHFYKSYMKYLAIDIQEASTAIPVKDKNEPVWEDSPFLAAYRSAFGGNEENDDAFKQVILAFTDIDPDGKDGYLKDAVERFWSDEAPILFISLINVSDATELAAISKQIRGRADEAHPRTLVYFTFDNCDLIVFHKGDRFGDYADQLFRLCFQEEKHNVVDSMTIYGFRFQKGIDYRSDEVFDVMLRFGVDDFKSIPGCFNDPAWLRQPGFIMGRSDVSYYYPRVNLKWLSGCIDALVENGGQNLHNVELMVIIRPDENKAKYLGETAARTLGKDGFIRQARSLKERFEKQYLYIHDREPLLQVDEVFLRWLNESFELACELYNNALSSDIGVCLLPQYINLFNYFLSFFKHYREPDAFVKVEEAVNRCFIAFFNNILTLLDSMNHSDRQFVQAPSFHSTSFEMPPKLLAYYTAATQYLVQALQDDDNYHGFTISPRFAQELDVIALDVDDRARDNMLSISIGESRLYTITHTTLVIAHEISHFVGTNNRCRERRRDCIVKAGIHMLLNALVDRLSSSEGKKKLLERFQSSGVLNAIDLIYHALQLKLPETYASDETLFLCDIQELVLPFLPEGIASQRETAKIVIEWVIKGFFDQDFFKSEESDGYEYEWRQAIGEQSVPAQLNDDTIRELLWSRVSDWFYSQFDDLENYFIKSIGDRDTEELIRGNFLCYMFSETFADLQTILLFKLTFQDYVRLLIYEDGSTIRDIAPRLLAVAKAMYGSEGWGESDAANVRDKYPITSDICELLPLDPFADVTIYGGKRFNAILIYYLTDYLKECKQKITKFLDEKASGPRDKLLDFYNKTGNDITVCQFETRIMSFLKDYAALLETNIVEQNAKGASAGQHN